jgi:hypothetical protein
MLAISISPYEENALLRSVFVSRPDSMTQKIKKYLIKASVLIGVEYSSIIGGFKRF